ncbi:MAG: hypothetical protein WC769_02825 [Thermodesulfovibrionales bacterium]
MPKIILKLRNGEEKTGEVLLFNINQPTFQMQTDRGDGTKETLTIRMETIKAVLFLKKDEGGGTRLRTETIAQSTYAGTTAFRLLVEFQDGEVISGSTLKYSPNDKGFFLVPINPADTSERIYVNAQAVKNVDCKRLLGKILVDQKKITHGQLTESLKYQQEQREKKIGTILKEKAIINERQLHESLKQQKEKNKMLGEILREAGYITSDQLEYALHLQQENRKKKLGQVLVELKYITPSDICIALATQFHKSWIDLSQVKILPEIAASLPEDLIRKFEVIPVEKKGKDTIVVATSQPQDSETQGILSKLTSLHIELVVAYEGYITSAINAYFPPKNKVLCVKGLR